MGAALGVASFRLPKNVKPGSREAYGFAVLCVALAAFVRALLGLVDNDILIFATFYPAILMAALIGGTSAGILATALGGVVGWWAFMPQHYSFVPLTPGHSLSLIVYGLSAAIIVWGADHYCSLAKRLENEEEFRKLAVEELAHRLKNKIATIHAVISSKMRDHPQLRDDVQSLLHALSATDDLILKTQGRGANIQDIIELEVKPYDGLRICRSGPNVFLTPKLATTMGLLIHELATNAAKHGALSSPAGRLAITWSVTNGRMTVDWQESDGPRVTTPAVNGFGTRLLTRALDQFGGTIERKFEPSGLLCKMSLDLPETSDEGEPLARGEDNSTPMIGEKRPDTSTLKLKTA